MSFNLTEIVGNMVSAVLPFIIGILFIFALLLSSSIAKFFYDDKKLTQKVAVPSHIKNKRYHGGDTSGVLAIVLGLFGVGKSLFTSHKIIHDWRHTYNIATNWTINFDGLEYETEYTDEATNWDNIFFLKKCIIIIDEPDQLSKAGRKDEIPPHAQWKIGQLRHFDCSMKLIIQRPDRINVMLRDLAHQIEEYSPETYKYYENVEGRKFRIPAKGNYTIWTPEDYGKKEKIVAQGKPRSVDQLYKLPFFGFMFEKTSGRTAVRPIHHEYVYFDWDTAQRYDTHAMISVDPGLKGAETIAPYLFMFDKLKDEPGIWFPRLKPENAIYWAFLHSGKNKIMPEFYSWINVYKKLFWQHYPDVMNDLIKRGCKKQKISL